MRRDIADIIIDRFVIKDYHLPEGSTQRTDTDLRAFPECLLKQQMCAAAVNAQPCSKY